MSTPRRHRDGFEHRFGISVPTREDPTQVVCPTCSARALVIPLDEHGARVTCASCGFSRDSDGMRRSYAWYAETPSDGYFDLDLWLQTACAGHSLWAFNRRHLDLLESYVGADLRERRRNESGWRNSSVASRLPKWMTAASNRSKVLASIEALRQKA